MKGAVRLLDFRQLGAVGEEDVLPAVAVVIENGHAAAHGLGKVLAAGEVVIGLVAKIRFGRDVDEPNGSRFVPVRGGFGLSAEDSP